MIERLIAISDMLVQSYDSNSAFSQWAYGSDYQLSLKYLSNALSKIFTTIPKRTPAFGHARSDDYSPSPMLEFHTALANAKTNPSCLVQLLDKEVRFAPLRTFYTQNIDYLECVYRLFMARNQSDFVLSTSSLEIVRQYNRFLVPAFSTSMCQPSSSSVIPSDDHLHDYHYIHAQFLMKDSFNAKSISDETKNTDHCLRYAHELAWLCSANYTLFLNLISSQSSEGLKRLSVYLNTILELDPQFESSFQEEYDKIQGEITCIQELRMSSTPEDIQRFIEINEENGLELCELILNRQNSPPLR